MKRVADLHGDGLARVAILVLISVLALAACTGKTVTPSATPSAMPVPKAGMFVYTAWVHSWHSNTQTDVAGELAAGRAGQTPDQVINGADAENCIACHAPTAVLANGGMTESQALAYFFTTAGGKVTKNTASAHAAEWPNVACATCHDPRYPPSPDRLSFFNSSTGQYEPMKNADELCGQCHGNLRFPGTDHLSYNILRGEGGLGVRPWQTMAGTPCIRCHMFVSGAGGSNSAQLAGHSLTIDVREPNGQITSSCVQSQCHANWTAQQADAAIAADKSDYAVLDAIAQKSVAAATAAMKSVSDEALQAKLAEAQHNLQLAESDESGGFHNNIYLMELLKDANEKATEVLTALGRSSA